MRRISIFVDILTKDSYHFLNFTYRFLLNGVMWALTSKFILGTYGFKSAAENTPSDLPCKSATSYELVPIFRRMTHGVYCGPILALNWSPADDCRKLRLNTRWPTSKVAHRIQNWNPAGVHSRPNRIRFEELSYLPIEQSASSETYDWKLFWKTYASAPIQFHGNGS